jgi:hypothetical protein
MVMKKLSIVLVLAVLVSVLVVSVVVQAAPSDEACWGQASAVYAQMGTMGEHASEMATPRDGLRNLARALYDDGTIADDTMQALGAFVASAEGLSIDACMD